MSRTGHKSLQTFPGIARLEAGLASSLAALTPRQRAFYDHWWAESMERCPRAYRSAQAAGYACPRSQGPRLLTMPNVRAAMDARLAVEQRRLDATERRGRWTNLDTWRDIVVETLAARLHR